VRKQVSIALVPEAQVGDYVIVHVGHAIGLLDPRRPRARWRCSPNCRGRSRRA
jgi:hydrogenase maturation factor